MQKYTLQPVQKYAPGAFSQAKHRFDAAISIDMVECGTIN
jgi:hypothetical protein